MWIWVLSFTVLGTNPEHGRIAKFETKQECHQALLAKQQQIQQSGRSLVGSCHLTRQDSRNPQ